MAHCLMKHKSMHTQHHNENWLPNTHPGEMLRLDFLEPMGISAYKLAKDIGLSQSHVSELVRGERNITALTASLLGRYFGMSAEFWIGLQTRHDLIEARRNHAEKLDRVIPREQAQLATV